MIPTCGTLDDSSLRSFEMLDARSLGSVGECRYLISLDYDGTLSSGGAPPIEPAFFELMESWRGQGVRWGINTGRSLYFLLTEYLDYFSVLPDFICTCERYAYHTDEAGILHACYDYNRDCHESHVELTARLKDEVRLAFMQMGSAHPHVKWELDSSDPLSIAAIDEAAMEQLMPSVHAIQCCYPELGVQRAGRFMRFCDARFSKGSALQQLRRHWDVAAQDCFLMGDGENDLDAFRLFPHAFCAAPVHSHPRVLRYVHERGGDVTATTVREALLRWGAQRGLVA